MKLIDGINQDFNEKKKLALIQVWGLRLILH